MSIVFLWGGLILSILHLMRHPEEIDINDQHNNCRCIHITS
ncbi:MetS family NSS transporter small subunit [Escherichia coli]